MKKILFLMLAVFIVNTACSSNVSNNQSEMNKK